jgi:hypothetical protein
MMSQGRTMLKLLDGLRLTRIGADADHPLASPREAAQIFAELRAGDPLKSLEEISDWLLSFVAAENLRPERRFEVIRQLDELAQPHRVKLARETGAQVRQSRPREAKARTVNHDLGERLSVAYGDLILRIEAREKGADALRKEVPLIAVRAMRACGARLKSLYLRYCPIPVDIWGALARAYRCTESRGLQHTRLQAYPGMPGESTPEEEYLRTLLVSASAPDALTPAELEVAERLIAHCAGKFHITLRPNADSTYWVDLANPRQPLRLAAPPTLSSPGLRFFATAAGHADIVNMLEQLEKNNEQPRGVDIGGTFEPALLADVLRHLRLNWAPRPPVRRSERRRLTTRISVMHGLAGIIGAMRPSELDLDFGADAASETWEIENLSGGGFGAAAPHTHGNWLRIGALLAAQPEGVVERWEIGIVRRLTLDDPASKLQARVGVQVISRAPIVGVFTTNIGRWAHGVATVEGIVIPEGGEPGAVLVALPHGLYLPGEQLLAMIAERRHLMFPIGLTERGEDYDLIRFRAMAQDD